MAFAAYSKLFCLEVELKRGVCVKGWHQIAKNAGEEAVSHLRAYTQVKSFTMNRQDMEKFFINHHDIMNIHGRSIADLVAKMGTCV